MLSRDFQNGKKLNLPCALAVFVVMMGFLFLLDASSQTQMLASIATIVIGFIWYFGNHAYHWWEHHHQH